MTAALTIYAATFMRYSLAVTPKNYLLFACHLTNFGAQVTQGFRYMNHFQYVAPLLFSIVQHLWEVHGAGNEVSATMLTRYSSSSWGGKEAREAAAAAQGKKAAEGGSSA